MPALIVDAGNLFAGDRYVPGQPLPEEISAKNRWVLKGYDEFRHDAANVGYKDLPYLAELMRKEGFDERRRELPFIDRLISANLRPVDGNLMAPAPYIIREITLKRGAPGRTVKVGIVGFTDAMPAGPNEKISTYAGYQIDDPLEAAKRVIPELKAKVDYVVVLAYMPEVMAQQIAIDNPDVDTVIAARQLSLQNPPQHFNRATITYAFNETKYLGELRYYVRGDGTIENQVNRYVSLDSLIPDDPDALRVVTAAHNDASSKRVPETSAARPPGSQ